MKYYNIIIDNKPKRKFNVNYGFVFDLRTAFDIEEYNVLSTSFFMCSGFNPPIFLRKSHASGRHSIGEAMHTSFATFADLPISSKSAR